MSDYDDYNDGKSQFAERIESDALHLWRRARSLSLFPEDAGNWSNANTRDYYKALALQRYWRNR